VDIFAEAAWTYSASALVIISEPKRALQVLYLC
jgi:hypothetical protein